MTVDTWIRFCVLGMAIFTGLGAISTMHDEASIKDKTHYFLCGFASISWAFYFTFLNH